MKIINEAIVGDYHFIVGEEYVAITHKGEEMVHIPHNEAYEVFNWVTRLITTSPVDSYSDLIKAEHAKTLKSVSTKPEVTYDPGNRKAKNTVPIGDGDPFLAQKAPNSSLDGRFQIKGVMDEDLGKAVIESGMPVIRK